MYIHRKRDSHKIFYVGIGSKKRAYDFYRSRNKVWSGIVRRTGEPFVEIVFSGLTWEQACRKEMRLIKLLGRVDNKTGQLCNLTDGGDGTKGWIPTFEYRQQLSKRSSGEYSPSKRPENRVKISEATKKL